MHGEGTAHGPDSSLYSGQLADDRRHGAGCMRYANGDVYEGEWADGSNMHPMHVCACASG